MKIGVKINQLFEKEKRLKAFATVFLESKFVVTGVRVLDCKTGLAVMMPSRKDNKGEYRDICFPITAELRAEINKTVIEAYEKAIAEEKKN